MENIKYVTAIGDFLQKIGHASLHPLGRMLQGTGTEADHAEWPGLALDMGRLASVNTAVMPVRTVDIYVMEWLETKRGWGQNPDGYSVNLSRNDYEDKLLDYCAKLPPRNFDGSAPEEYSRPAWDTLRVLCVPKDGELAKAAITGCWRIHMGSPQQRELDAFLYTR